MVIRDGFQSYRLCWPHEGRSEEATHSFGSREHAFEWLTHLHLRHSDFLIQLRSLIYRYTGAESCTLSDQEVFWQVAWLLHSRRLVVICFDQPRLQSSSRAVAPQQTTSVAFPLPDRKRSAAAPAPVQASPPPEDATFSDEIDFPVQAGVLVQAARSGVPFCPE